MAWGEKKEMLIAENAVQKREIELLREQLGELKQDRLELKNQLRATQEALIAKESPEAYRDQKYEADQAAQEEPTDEEREAVIKQRQRAEIAGRYLTEMESDLFKSPDDMIQILTRGTGAPLSETASLHGNDES
jgi:formate-dependent nitrite reductase cytochrome c552 subunit